MIFVQLVGKNMSGCLATYPLLTSHFTDGFRCLIQIKYFHPTFAPQTNVWSFSRSLTVLGDRENGY